MESIQLRAFHIILNSQYIDYESLCKFYNLGTLKDVIVCVKFS